MKVEEDVVAEVLPLLDPGHDPRPGLSLRPIPQSQYHRLVRQPVACLYVGPRDRDVVLRLDQLEDVVGEREILLGQLLLRLDQAHLVPLLVGDAGHDEVPLQRPLTALVQLVLVDPHPLLQVGNCPSTGPTRSHAAVPQ